LTRLPARLRKRYEPPEALDSATVTESVASAAPHQAGARLGRTDKLVLAVLAVFVFFSLNFGADRVFGDGVNYYSLTQRIFGDRHGGSGYNFGVGIMNVPFYGAAKVASVGAGHEQRLERASITIASITWVLLAAILSWWILAKLELPGRPLALAAAIFGTPVWYYASFSPAYSHATDAAAFALASWAMFGLWSSPALAWRLGAAGALGLAVAVRPFNAGVAAGAVFALAAFRHFRDAIIVGVGAIASYLALAAVPYALGLSFTRRVDGTEIADTALGFSPLSPLRMLVTNHRGLFIWTPVTLLAVVGLALLIRDHPSRPFLVTLAAMGAGLVLMNLALKPWDAGWSFSERYLASPVTLYAVGVAGLLASTRAWSHTAAAAAAIIFTGWSLLIGMNHAFGASQSDGAIAVATKRSPSEFVHRAWAYSRLRHVVDKLHG